MSFVRYCMRKSTSTPDRRSQDRESPAGSSHPAPAETLSGLIERVTYFNEENGFSVLQIKTKSRRNLTTVVGHLPSASPGEWVTAEGGWVHDREHGLQFKATVLAASPPTSLEGIEKYLGSGLIKGIGPVYAKKLVDKFGERVLEVIEEESGRLEEVEGIGPGRRQRIKDAWAEQRIVREIMVFLHSHGVSTSRAMRIYKTYGEHAVAKLREDPYRLARDIHGIGFRSADKIAQQMGIPRDSLLRASAGVAFVLMEAAGEGHCALPRELVLQKAVALLDLDGARVVEALHRMLANGEVVVEQIGGETLLFLPRLRRAEESVAERLRRLAALPPNRPLIDIPRAIAWCEERNGYPLSKSQAAAFELAIRNRVCVITGGPGVGKTTLVRSVLAVLSAKKVKMLLCAPTGRAAKRLSESTGREASTIHRLLEARAGGFGRDERNPLDCDGLIVDEASMVDLPLVHALLRALPQRAGVIFVGDRDQLPSVGPGRVFADIIESGCVPVARLTEIFRQATGSAIVVAAHAINRGEMPPPLPADADFYFVERETPEEISRTLCELVAERIPRRLGANAVDNVQVLSPMNRGNLGVRELNARLQQLLNPPSQAVAEVSRFGWTYRTGDKVIQLENDYDKEVYNGDIGRITGLDVAEGHLTVRFDGRDIDYALGEIDALAPAYAITIHKSQGSEFPAVVIPVSTQHYVMLQRNLIYTGLTRGKKLVVLVGQRRALAMAINNAAANDRASQRWSGLLARLREGLS